MASALRSVVNHKSLSLLRSNVELKVFLPNSSCTLFVRWVRKPLWLGPSKSKMYWVPKRPNPPPDEVGELHRLYPRYKTQVRAIYDLIKENMKEQQALQAQALQFQSKEEEEAEWAECVALNDEWNSMSAALREQRIARQLAMVEELALQKKLEKDAKEKKLIAEIDARVRLEKEKSKTFITEANIDEAIEKALDNLVDYNFSIDLQGNIYHGRGTKPGDVQKKVKSIKPEVIKSTAYTS